MSAVQQYGILSLIRAVPKGHGCRRSTNSGPAGSGRIKGSAEQRSRVLRKHPEEGAVTP